MVEGGRIGENPAHDGRAGYENVGVVTAGEKPMAHATPNDKKDDLAPLEFELTDFDTARQALDALPPGVAEVHRLQPGYWEERRRPAQPTDRALAGGSLEWMVRLPPSLRPRATAEQYPRVVNRIAASWSDPSAAWQTLDDLLEDHRGGRRGFPFEVESELKSLRRFRAQGS